MMTTLTGSEFTARKTCLDALKIAAANMNINITPPDDLRLFLIEKCYDYL